MPRSKDDVRKEINEVAEQIDSGDRERAIYDMVRISTNGRDKGLTRLEMRRDMTVCQQQHHVLEPHLKILSKEFDNLI